MEEPKHNLSVILTAYNNDDLTVVHARECMNSSRVPDEVIVVNDGGDPSLESRLRQLDFKCRFVYARINEDIPWNYNGACNLGVWLSTGNLLAFEDNDNIPNPDFYEHALKFLEENPNVGRVSAVSRQLVSLDDMLNKPKDQWKIIKCIGPNQGTAIIKRDIYTLVKGQDERFCGEYGWMYYEWRRKLLNRAKVTFGKVGAYFYTQDGQTSIPRGMSSRNSKLMRYNSEHDVLQAPSGILNFTYTLNVLHP